MTVIIPDVTVGVLALQGAFSEHVQLLRSAAHSLKLKGAPAQSVKWNFIEVRTPDELARCDGLILPGGESTTISMVAARSGLLEPLRDFVKVLRKPTWGTCAGLILLAESANRTKKGGQDLIGGLDVRVNRNHFGRQVESFQASLQLSFLGDSTDKTANDPYRCVFIRAPVVEKILPHKDGVQTEEESREATIVAPSKIPANEVAEKEIKSEVEVMATLPTQTPTLQENQEHKHPGTEDIIAVRQGNVFGISFHPELTADARIHVWWLQEVLEAVQRRRQFEVVDRPAP
ncbi:SNO glutamine amidotransferase [Bimuria novae-zelandiae CBS 107.79]|uniref:glutaminase n=1 Tax=Bimuria novae-zelandiae CBS 107.79 TaxID=1447943 RepID=A0A6A5VBS2_9PLEO|nr:SNO glutamine amidotransferase [Bimuria novae-zelandiae CBS 107.79]